MALDSPAFSSNRVSGEFQQQPGCSQNWGKMSLALVTSVVALAAIGLLVTGLLAHFEVITTLSSAISYGFIGAGGGVLGLEVLSGMLLFACLICKCQRQESSEETDPTDTDTRAREKTAHRRKEKNREERVRLEKDSWIVATYNIGNLITYSLKKQRVAAGAMNRLAEHNAFCRDNVGKQALIEERSPLLKGAFTQLSKVADIVCLQGVDDFSEEELEEFLPGYSFCMANKEDRTVNNIFWVEHCAVAWKTERFDLKDERIVEEHGTSYVMLQDKKTKWHLRVCSFLAPSKGDDLQENLIRTLQHFEVENKHNNMCLTVLGLSMKTMQTDDVECLRILEDDSYATDLKLVYQQDRTDNGDPTVLLDYRTNQPEKLDYVFADVTEHMDFDFKSQNVPDQLAYDSDLNPSDHGAVITQVKVRPM